MTHSKPRKKPEPPAATTAAASPASRIRKVLVVDSERSAADFTTDLSITGLQCVVFTATTIAEARKILATESVSILMTELKLPDGRGLSILPELRKLSPEAGVLVTGKSVKLDDVIEALRSGAGDVLPKPFTHEQLRERLLRAFSRQDRIASDQRRIARLRSAVRKLSEARRTVARKVDLLCNDLVGAYSELSKQVDTVRTTEDFRKLCEKSKDLEQLLCHAMDWIMRRVGYANIAVFLATEETFQLGAYVKYTVQSSPELAAAIRDGVVARAAREGFVRLSGDEAARQLTAAELRHLRGQAMVAANCTYLGESLATVVLFRDQDTPFSTEDAETFRAIAPVFAIALAGQVRAEGGEGGEDFGPGGDEDGEWRPEAPPDSPGEALDSSEGEDADRKSEKRRRQKENSDADWWKRGESPPF
jgi:DNA-binding response OmpR family regulator